MQEAGASQRCAQAARVRAERARSLLPGHLLVVRFDGAEHQVERDPEGAREWKEDDWRDHHEWNSAPQHRVPRRVRPRHEHDPEQAEREHQLGNDKVEATGADEVKPGCWSRDAGCPAPPPRIPACGFPALGSCLRSERRTAVGDRGEINAVLVASAHEAAASATRKHAPFDCAGPAPGTRDVPPGHRRRTTPASSSAPRSIAGAPESPSAATLPPPGPGRAGGARGRLSPPPASPATSSASSAGAP